MRNKEVNHVPLILPAASNNAIDTGYKMPLSMPHHGCLLLLLMWLVDEEASEHPTCLRTFHPNSFFLRADPLPPIPSQVLSTNDLYPLFTYFIIAIGN